MSSAGVAPRTAAAIDARRRTTQAMLQRVRDALTQLRRHKTPITFPAVARRAAVSRTFLYANPGARRLVTDAIAETAGRRAQAPAEHDAELEASWRERALNTEAALTDAHTEIRTQRDRIAALMGQIRDTEREWSEDAIQQITTENTTLKQRVRQLTQENRTLEERLHAARSNARFADRRISQLEARLTEPPANQT
jgi:outer membrane murein-binding lipoprotein Lpp